MKNLFVLISELEGDSSFSYALAQILKQDLLDSTLDELEGNFYGSN